MESEQQIGFSTLALSMRDFENVVEIKKLTTKESPWSAEEATEEKRLERVAKCKDFWQFDKTYFGSEMYSDGYSEPSYYHKLLVSEFAKPGISINMGPRKHGKTVTAKKKFVHALLYGEVNFAGTLSSTLPTSRNILADITELIGAEKIAYDYKPELIEGNKDQFTMKVPGLKSMIRVSAFSEGRSARGATFLFTRPQLLLCDDLETRQSALGEEQTHQRIKIIQEAFQSMSESGVLLVLGNNFDEKCALNRLVKENEEGLLPNFYRINSFKAWNNYPLWPERYPAKSEDELKKMLKVTDITEWLAEFQQTPTSPDGMIFKRLAPLPEFYELPADARGVLYCDPNLAKKGRGDFTAITKLLYSPEQDSFYIADYVCKSFNDSNDLLNKYLQMKDERVRACGFDGHVNQESTWTNNIRNWCRVNKAPFPTIFYKRYHVDELAKNIQGLWSEGKIKIPAGMYSTKMGRLYLDQLFSFSGKKAGKKDDAPDSLICAYELLNERHLANKKGTNKVTRITDFFNF